jgi:hypothetical protein
VDNNSSDSSSRWLSSLENVPPALVAGFSILTGVLLIVGSVLAHTDKAVFSAPDKTLGYFYEINWSVNYVVVIPVALYFCATAMNGIRHVIAELAKHKMVVGKGGVPRERSYLLEDWHRIARRAIYIGSVLGLVALLISWREWLLNFAYNPSLDLATIKQQPGLLPGWNLAPVAHAGRYFRVGKLFGFFAFTAQGFVAAFYISFICVIYGFATWIYRFTTDSTEDELVPDASSSDTRRGFERFEPLIETLLSAALAFFVVFFLTRMDNEFVLSDSANLGEFIKSDLWYGFKDGVSGLFKGNTDLFSLGKDWTYSMVMVGTGLGVAIVTGFLFPAVIVRQAAISSHDRMEHAPDPMVFWPLQYPKPMQLILLIILASACFIFYRLTLAMVGVLIALAVKEFYDIFKTRPGTHCLC